MSKDAIINSLAAKLTDDEIKDLKKTSSKKDFLQSLINIYESRAGDYLNSCERKVRRIVEQKNAYEERMIKWVSLYHIIDLAYSAFLEIDKTSLLISLNCLLKKISPELSISLCMNVLNKGKNNKVEFYNLEAQLMMVFKAYISRYCLFRDIASKDLVQLCNDIGAGAANLFPNHLIQAFHLQRQLAAAVQQKIANQNQDENTLWATALSEIINQNANLFVVCLQSLITFISQVIQSSNVPNAYKKQFFNHLDSESSLQQFTSGLCMGYVQKMTAATQQLEIFNLNSSNLQTDIGQVCMPAMSLLGLNVAVNTNKISQRATELNNALNNIRDNKNAIDRRANELRDESNRNIDTARANFTPQWSVGFGPGVNTPGASFRF